MTAAGEIADAVHRSSCELRALGRTPVRVRMHPLDAEVLLAYHFPHLAGRRRRRWWRFNGLTVVEDEATRIGEPVAEFNEEAVA